MSKLKRAQLFFAVLFIISAIFIIGVLYLGWGQPRPDIKIFSPTSTPLGSQRTPQPPVTITKTATGPAALVINSYKLVCKDRGLVDYALIDFTVIGEDNEYNLVIENYPPLRIEAHETAQLKMEAGAHSYVVLLWEMDEISDGFTLNIPTSDSSCEKKGQIAFTATPTPVPSPTTTPTHGPTPTPGDGNTATPTSTGTISESPPIQAAPSEDRTEQMTLLVSFSSLIISTLGFLSTTILNWRKEARERKKEEMELKIKEIELEKQRLELERFKAESPDKKEDE